MASAQGLPSTGASSVTTETYCGGWGGGAQGPGPGRECREGQSVLLFLFLDGPAGQRPGLCGFVLFLCIETIMNYRRNYSGVH